MTEAHLRKRFRETTPDLVVEPGSCGEHAVRIGWRRPYLGDASRRHQRLLLHTTPEGASDRARICFALENRPQDVDLAGSRVAVLAEVRIEAQRPIIPSFGQAELSEKVYRKDRGMAAVAAAQRQDSTAQIVKLPDRPPVQRDDLGGPAE